MARGWKYGQPSARRQAALEATEEPGTRAQAPPGRPATPQGRPTAAPTPRTRETTVVGRLRERQGLRKTAARSATKRGLPAPSRADTVRAVDAAVGPRQRPSPRKPKTGK